MATNKQTSLAIRNPGHGGTAGGTLGGDHQSGGV